MGEKYHQFSLIERDRIAILRAEGRSIREIGKVVGRSHGSISREFRRNNCFGPYLPQAAHEKAYQKKQKSGQRRRLKSIWIANSVI